MAVHVSFDSGIRNAPVVARTRSSFATRSQSVVGLSSPEFFDALVENYA
jgi:hypothetical protein